MAIRRNGRPPHAKTHAYNRHRMIEHIRVPQPIYEFLLWYSESGHCPLAELIGSSRPLSTRPRRFALISGDASFGSRH
jgi:hypothetical protein